MALPKKYDFNDYDNYLTDPNPTTSAEAQDYFRNMDMLVAAMVDTFLWQPETNYKNGDVVKSPSMPNGAEAVCVSTNGGKSSNVEPQWGNVGGENIADGTCFWKLRWGHWSKDVILVGNGGTGASDAENARANLGLSYATQAQAEVGENNNVVVTPLSAKQAIDKQRPIKTFTSLEELGLDNNASEVDILLAMPRDSILFLPVNNNGGTNYPNFAIQKDGFLTIECAYHNASRMFFTTSKPLFYYATYKSWATPNFSDWHKIATQGALSMPSVQKINIDVSSLNVESSAWTYLGYTAPADGWVQFSGGTGTLQATRSIIQLRNKSNRLTITELLYGLTWSQRDIFIPCSKGQEVELGVVNCKGTEAFFVYAQSEV